MKYEEITIADQSYLYVDKECSIDGEEIAKAMEEGFVAVFGFVSQHGLTPLSMPMSLYPEMPTDKMRFRAAVKVSAEDAAKASDGIQSDKFPTGRAMKSVHVGSYESLGASHKAMWDHMEKQGAENPGMVWEIYVDDPGTVPAEKVRTEIFRAFG